MNNIYIELDGLFDTRLPILTAINEDVSTRVFNKDYDIRTNDKFELIPNNIFNLYYNQRNKDILTYALPSFIYKLIENITTEYYSDLKNNNGLQKLYINTYPYMLEDSEKQILITSLSYIKQVEIEFLFISDNDLTPNILNNYDLDYIIKYNGIEWLEKQNRLLNIIDNPMLDKYLYVPALIDNTHIEKSIKINKEFFNTLSKSLGMIINVIFTDIIYWNTIKK